MTQNVTQLPDPGVILDLDTYEKEDPKPPYKFNLMGRVLTLLDPEDVDWQILAAVELPQDIIRACMSDDDRSYFFRQVLPSGKFTALMESYYDHYDVAERIRQAKTRLKSN